MIDPKAQEFAGGKFRFEPLKLKVATPEVVLPSGQVSVKVTVKVVDSTEFVVGVNVTVKGQVAPVETEDPEQELLVITKSVDPVCVKAEYAWFKDVESPSKKATATELLGLMLE